MEEEMSFHLKMQIEQNLEAGMANDEAHHAARRQFGNQTWLKEASREMWSFRSLETLLQDLRYSLRMMVRNPSFTAVAILTLTLGIGACTAIFSVVYAAMLRPLPYCALYFRPEAALVTLNDGDRAELADVGLQAVALPSGVRFLPGPVNGLLVYGRVLVYGDTGGRVKEASHVLFTHARRDVVWAGTALVRGGSAAVVPERERSLFENPASFWESYWSGRFHDYSQVNTKVLREPVRVSRAVRGGEVLDLGGVRVEVIDTPGYTAGAISYWIESGGKRIACTGDLIYGDGQLFDVSSLQDAIPESKTRGYHGYAARAGDLIESLRKIAARKPDVLVPARGPLIENPQQAIERLITRLQGLMASHFATDALHWYWGEESLRIRSRKAMDGRAVDSMPMAEQRPLPDWVKAIGNSRLLVSRTGAGFLIDAGFKGLLSRLQEADRVQGIWITHYHDDHTDYAQTIANRFACPVYFTQRMRDVLERPSHYRLPCLTENPITSGKPQADGVRMRWHEFELSFFDFPGQTLYHGGLLVERDGGEKLFFVGDSFTPSGIDDYCLQNRDFAREGEGFLYCLGLLDRLGEDAPLWLINQHVGPMFRFSAEQSARMRSELRKRMAILQELAPWPDLNYAIDESWAAVAPYGSEVRSGERVPVQVRILNHSAKMETYRVKWNVPSGWRVVKADEKVTIGPRKEGSARAVFAAAGEGLRVITADIEFGGRQLREWTEGVVRVRP
jgi:glyoxylase-like metal-dependent hydrolase (beta-lactamase superfamily II)